MKKKSILILSAIVISVFLVTSTSFAQTEWITCSIKRASSNDGETMLLLGHVTGGTSWTGNQWFTVASTLNNEALAVGLSAISLGYNIRVGRVPGTFTLTMVGLESP